MGTVLTPVKLTNEIDLGKVRERRLKRVRVRSVTVPGLVNTGAISMVVPARVIAPLGLPVLGHERVTVADGRSVTLARVGPVRIEILGRDMVLDVLVMPRGKHVLVGQVPLELLDLVVDPRSREIRTNPEHPNGPIFDLFALASSPAA